MPTPNIQLRRMSAELVRLRRAAGMTHDDVQRITHLSRNSVSRAERAIGRPHLRTLLTLLDLYAASEDDRQALLELHAAAGVDSTVGWLARYDDALPGEYPAYIQFEAEATVIRAWDALFVPGLLQTADYARAIIEGGARRLSKREIDNRVAARVARQELLQGSTYLDAVIDEGALRRPIGGVAVMRAQLKHLAEVSKAPNVSLQILPSSCGAHAGLSGPFRVLEFEATPPTVYLEHISGDVFLQDKEEVKLFKETFEQLKGMAWTPERSRRAIQQMKLGKG